MWRVYCDAPRWFFCELGTTDGPCYVPFVRASFHISLGVRSLEESVRFFVEVLNAKVTHRDPSGYVNIDFFGNEITLKPNREITPGLPDFHFGVNLSLADFDALAEKILATSRERVVMEPKLVDADSPVARTKMYIRCPTGYLIEIKGYAWHQCNKK